MRNKSKIWMNPQHTINPICELCIAGKQHANLFPLTSHCSQRPLELVHSNLKGPLPPTLSGFRYWMTFINDYSSFWVVSLLRRKSNAFDAFKNYKAYTENLFGQKILTLHNDKGEEYMSNVFQCFCNKSGIARRHTVRNRPQQNSNAERANRTLGEGVTTLLAESGLPDRF
jgi:hypothetical protein